MIVFVDFRDSGINGSEFRKMIRTLKKVPIFHSTEGKKIFFDIKKESNVEYFLLNLEKILNHEGLKTQLIYR